MSSQMQSFAQAYTAAWCSNDPSSVAEFFASDGSLKVNDSPPAKGRAEITAVAQGFMTAFPDLQVFMDDLILDPTGPIYHWTLTGTYRETGKPIRISGKEVWKISEDGLIASSLGHFDQADYQRQIQP